MLYNEIRNQRNSIKRHSLEIVQLLPFVKNEAFTTKDMEVTHLGCATVHELVTGFLLVIPELDPVRHIARRINRLSPESSRNPMLIEHCPSHLPQGLVYPFHHAILGRHIRTRKLVFRTKVTAEDIKREFLNSEPLSLWIARMVSLFLLFLNLKTRSRTKPNVSPFSSRKNTHT
jgi:hypothetical protein